LTDRTIPLDLEDRLRQTINIRGGPNQTIEVGQAGWSNSRAFYAFSWMRPVAAVELCSRRRQPDDRWKAVERSEIHTERWPALDSTILAENQSLCADVFLAN